MANIKNFGIVGLGSNVQFGKGGAKLIQTEGTFAAKSADNSAFVRFAIANAVGAEDAVTLQQLNAAVAAAGAEVDVLQAELDATQAGAGLGTDGTYSAPATGVLSTATSLKDADDKLAAALASEIADRAADEAALAAAIAVANAAANAAQLELDVSQASIGLTPEGALTLADGNYLANATTIVAAVEALDAATKAAADAAALAQADADAAEAAAAALDTRVDAAELDITALEGNAVAQQAELDALFAADQVLDGRIDLLETSAAADDTRLDNLEANSVTQQSEIDAAEAAAVVLAGRVTTAEGDITALEANAVTQQSEIDAAEAAAVILAGRVTTAEGDITALEGNAVAQQAAIDAAAGRLTLAEGDIDLLQSDLNAAELAHAALLANAIVKDGSVAFTGSQSMGGFALTNVATPVNPNDAAPKGYVDGVVANLGNAFNYVTTLSGGADEASAFDLATLPATGKNVGDYYKVIADGFFKLGAEVRYFNTNDGLVFNSVGSFDKIDNTDSVVNGTAGQIDVDGNVDTGFIVSIDGAYTAARQLEVSNEANTRAAADAVLTGAVADVAADLAAEILDRASDELALANATALVASNLATEITARQALETSTTANAVAQQAAIDALEAAVGDDSRLDALEAKDIVHDGLLAGLESNAAAQDIRLDNLEAADVVLDGRLDTAEADIVALEGNAVAQQAAISALVAADVALDARLDTAEADIVALEAADVALDARVDALEAADIALDARLDTAELDITALEGNAVAQQIEIDALELALENLSQDTITSLNEDYAVHAANTKVEVTNVNADTKLEVTLTNGEARMSATSTALNADLRLVAQGTGQVIIGDEGAGIIQADDGQDMTVAGGVGGGELFLTGSKVSVQDEDGTNIATFVSGGSAQLDVSTTSNAVSFAANGVDADVDLVFDPKGAGRVNVSGSKVVNVANGVDASDAVNKGQLDAAVAASEVGHVVSLAANVTTSTANVGAEVVTGVVTRVRVVVTNAYNAGAVITVGYTGNANALVAATDLDESAAGVYIIETAAEVTAAQLLVTISGATSGAAKVYVEYIKG